MKLIFLGPPGAGKGTMAARVKEYLGIPHISTGNLFRENVAEKTQLGMQVKEIMEQGNLVPDDLTIAIVKERLSRPDAEKGFILDGFPRTILQAEALEKMTSIKHVLNLICPDRELIRRLTGRRFCPACGRSYHVEFIPPKQENICDDDGHQLSIRDDDTLEAVQNRLNVYMEKTRPLIEWYENRGLLRNIEADVPP
ncbi:MAG: adenylate kinase, partial [Spirochaetales bacterium]